MSLFDAILTALDTEFGSATVQTRGVYRTANKKFAAEAFQTVRKQLHGILEEWQSAGETLVIDGKGRINDSGKVQFDIEPGLLVEYYHYEQMTVLFIRLYRVHERRTGKVWTALYLDENPQTPWWPTKEREAERKNE